MKVVIAAAIRRTSVAIPLVLCTLAAGCATNAGARAGLDRPPAPFVLLVDVVAANGVDPALRVHYGDCDRDVPAALLAGYLAEELRAVDASSRVVTRAELGGGTPDLALVVQPKAQRHAIDCSYVGASQYLAAGGLWLCSWIGGLMVADSTYRVDIDANCIYALDAHRATDASYRRRHLRPVSGDDVDLSFFERSEGLGWPLVQSFVLPPFWTSDEAEATAATLTRSAMRIIARKVESDLKIDFARSRYDLGCSMTITSTVKNGEPVTGETMPLRLEIAMAEAKVESVVAIVNDGEPIEFSTEPFGGSTRAGGLLTGLDPERENWVRLTITGGGVHRRTLRFAAANARH